VTGASAGIGLALSRAIAREGRPVLAVARRAERLEALAAEASNQRWAPIHPVPVDIAADGAAAEVLAHAEALGGAEWLINNAGFGLYGTFADSDPARLSEMIRVNCEAVVLLTRAFLPALFRRGGGFVLNVASVAGFQPMPYLSVYGATKAFVLSFTEGLSEELRGTGVGAGAFCPGPVATEFQQVSGTARRPVQGPGRLTAEEAARRALAQIHRRKVVRVPSLVYRLWTVALRLFPRRVISRLSGRVYRPAEPGRDSRPDGSSR
jgi:short-subunit dehydrogenase